MDTDMDIVMDMDTDTGMDMDTGTGMGKDTDMGTDMDISDELSIFIESYLWNHLTLLFRSDDISLFSDPHFEKKTVAKLDVRVMAQIHRYAEQQRVVLAQVKSYVSRFLASYIDGYFVRRSMPSVFSRKKQKAALDSQKAVLDSQNAALDKKMVNLKNTYQPIQRSTEWYEFRHSILTASTIYRVYGTVALQNSLIYEKCMPFVEHRDMGIHTAMHWGVKYEPVTISLYEKKYGTTISDFGCIRHPSIDYIGASPDGINTDVNNARYGRMIEVKNTVSRIITGIPTREYWIQMQIQMEVCDLDECDFIETKFSQIPEDTFYAEVRLARLKEKEEREKRKEKGREEEEEEEEEEETDFANGGTMGAIIHFFDVEKDAMRYCYMPVDIVDGPAIKAWLALTIAENSALTVVQTLFWRLDVWSCVLVPRNPIWFQYSAGPIRDIWTTIQRERIEGCAHRGPRAKKRVCYL